MVVLAGSAAQFHLWCRQNGRDPRSKSVIYARSPDVLRGLVDVDVVRFGSFLHHPQAYEIECMLGRIKARNQA